MWLSESERGYLAGFIDADGSICTRVQRNGKIFPLVQVYQKDRDALDYWRDKTGCGTVIVNNYKAWKNPIAVWGVRTYYEVYDLLSIIVDHMYVKRDLAIAIIELCLVGLGRSDTATPEAIRERIFRLNAGAKNSRY